MGYYKVDWVEGVCPICGKTYSYMPAFPYVEGKEIPTLIAYPPKTCGKYECNIAFIEQILGSLFPQFKGALGWQP